MTSFLFFHIFSFTVQSFDRIFVKSGMYMHKVHAQAVTISDLENSSKKKKLWRHNITTADGNRLYSTIISETREAFWILFVGIKWGHSHRWFDANLIHHNDVIFVLWRHHYFLKLFCFTTKSFHQNILKLDMFMQKAHTQTVTISDWGNSSKKKVMTS